MPTASEVKLPPGLAGRFSVARNAQSEHTRFFTQLLSLLTLSDVMTEKLYNRSPADWLQSHTELLTWVLDMNQHLVSWRSQLSLSLAVNHACPTENKPHVIAMESVVLLQIQNTNDKYCL